MPDLLQSYLTHSAERAPQANCLVLDNAKFTYVELERTTNQLARLLRDAGCRRGDRVCFLVPKSPLAIACLIAVLKADCIHVPLNETGPAARIAKIIRSCEPRLLLAGGVDATMMGELLATGALSDIGIGWVGSGSRPPELPVRFELPDIAAYSGESLSYANRPDSPSHILFTSGSTGTPKGVVITHSNVIQFIDWAVRYFQITESERLSGHTPLHFDLSQFDIFGAFATGAELHLVPHELSLFPNKLVDWILGSALTQWFSVPSVLHYIAKFDALEFNHFPDLRRVLWCGETLSTPVLIHWMTRLPNVQFTNLYGPTETTIASSYYTLPACPEDEKAAIPIGRPCDGEDLLVLDGNLQPVPRGEVGDLYISGVGLSPGYWQDEEKTSSAFLPNPFPHSGDRVYKTGDLAKVGEDDLVYFIGRVDSQIKSRGYRIELGEIEAAMNSIDLVRECVVVAVPSTGFEGMVICCAYSSNNPEVSPATLRSRLTEIIPSYMIPSRWLQCDELPKNSNGKVDRPRIRQYFSEPSGDHVAAMSRKA